MSETPEYVKNCCADLYASDWARLLLGDSFHPGGLGLTDRLAEQLGLGSDRRVLDVAASREPPVGGQHIPFHRTRTVTNRERYRLIVIGGGSAGLAAADFASRFGVSVGLIERNRVGGDCTWTGCVPSKALLHVARIAHVIRRAPQVGIGSGASEPLIDFARAMASVRQAVSLVYRYETPAMLRRRGIDLIKGEARFVDPHTIAVGDRRIRGERFVVATGAAPAIPAIPGLHGVPFLTYESVFDLKSAPARLLVLGAGPSGVELAQAFRRLGVGVVLIDRLERVASVADPEASAILASALAREGICLRLGASVRQVTPTAQGTCAEVDGQFLLGDALLLAAGRRPRVEDLDLDRAGIAWSPSGISVDEHLRTSQPHVYACGDVIGSFQFTHYAGWQAFIAVRNALFPGRSLGNHTTPPWAIFTDPEVAQVGLAEDQARERLGTRVRVTRWEIDRVDRAMAEDQTDGFIKLVHEPNGKLLGATIVCPAAGELANELSVALAAGLGVQELAGAIHVYPTYGFGIQQASATATLDSLMARRMGRALAFAARVLP